VPRPPAARGPSSASGKVSRATLTSQVEAAIRSDIINGVMAPGEHLRAAELVERYGVSPTPLREALQRLATQRLVKWDARLGASVASVSHDELRDIYATRELLEAAALERSIANGTAEWESEVNETWERLKSIARPSRAIASSRATDWVEAHRAFHRAIFDACESAWLLRFIETLAEHSERYRVMSAMTGSRDTIEEHARIWRAAVARDVPAALEAQRSHLAGTVSLIEDRFRD
jgi:GntR family carbon starvation induced transcriptional regulator